MKKAIMFCASIMLAMSSQLMAEELEVKLTKAKEYGVVTHGDKRIKVQRIQDTSHVIDGSFAKTSRPCPPFCVAPMSAAPGVTTVAELEVIEFMEGPLYNETGVIVDARTPSWHKRGTIPGSINIPFTEFEKATHDFEVIEILESLGGVERGEVNPVERMIEGYGFLDGDTKTEQWDFTHAKDVLFWCNGPWCGQSPRAIKALLAHGYPEEKIFYYRGGMQMWQSLGLTTVRPVE